MSLSGQPDGVSDHDHSDGPYRVSGVSAPRNTRQRLSRGSARSVSPAPSSSVEESLSPPASEPEPRASPLAAGEGATDRLTKRLGPGDFWWMVHNQLRPQGDSGDSKSVVKVEFTEVKKHEADVPVLCGIAHFSNDIKAKIEVHFSSLRIHVEEPDPDAPKTPGAEESQPQTPTPLAPLGGWTPGTPGEHTPPWGWFGMDPLA